MRLLQAMGGVQSRRVSCKLRTDRYTSRGTWNERTLSISSAAMLRCHLVRAALSANTSHTKLILPLYRVPNMYRPFSSAASTHALVAEEIDERTGVKKKFMVTSDI